MYIANSPTLCMHAPLTIIICTGYIFAVLKFILIFMTVQLCTCMHACMCQLIVDH
jgi:hypothetical protein